MAQWDGQGLPPVARQRLARAAESGVRTSLLSVPAAAGLETVGLDSVGEVMGCIVQSVSWQGYAGCGIGYGGFGGGLLSSPARTVGTRDSRWAAFRPYADAIRRGYATALHRLVAEATALGADGVVGISFRVQKLDQAREFVALGTAVRAPGSARPPRPFTTDLPGTDVAKLMRARWVPVSLVVAFDMAIRHDDWRTQNQASYWGGTTEVSGYTELTQHVRDTVRTDVREEVRRLGADGFVSSAITLDVLSIEPAEGHRDHVAESLMTGTAVARVDRSTGWRPARPADPAVAPRSGAVPVLSLKDMSLRKTTRRSR